jgi:hypothetical protein
MHQASVYQGLDLLAVRLQLCLKRLAAAAVVVVAAAVVLPQQLASLLQATSGHSVRNNVSDSTNCETSVCEISNLDNLETHSCCCFRYPL